MNAVKGVIFDFDGTLYDLKFFPLCCVLRHPKDAVKIRAERFARQQLKGREWDSSAAMEAEFGAIMAKTVRGTAESLSRWHVERFPQLIVDVLKSHFSARDGARELILALSGAGIKTAVFSDYSHTNARMSAIGLGQDVQDSLAGLFSSTDFACFKPASKAFLTIAEIMHLSPEECLVVGDRDDTDGEGARRCGMSFIQIIGEKTKLTNTNAASAMRWSDFVAWARETLLS